MTRMPTEISFQQLFGFTNPDEIDIPHLAREACRAGYAVVPVRPGTKIPLCPLTEKQRQVEDKKHIAAAYQDGDRNWSRRTHPCGVHHAMTEPDKAHRAFKRLTQDHPGLNIGLEVGRSKMLCVDADNQADVDAFLALWREKSETDDPALTVASPGVVDSDGEWQHSGGGHFWFTLPDDVDLTESTTARGLPLGNAQVFFKDRLVLVPPSVREEGGYQFLAEVHPAPPWLLSAVYLHVEGHAERVRIQKETARSDTDDPAKPWAADTPWEVLLEPDGWTRGSGMVDTCGCEIWRAPGQHASPKSATAHEAGCSDYDVADGRLMIWTDNPPDSVREYQEQTGHTAISKLAYYAWSHHGGDYGAAMRALHIPASDAYADEQEQELRDLLGDDTPPSEESEEDDEEELATLAGDETTTKTEFDEAVDFLLYKRRIRRAADIAEAAELRPEPVTGWNLSDLLAVELDQEKYLVDGLWPYGGNLQLTAQYKSGKTHAAINMVQAIVDGDHFLGRFDTARIDGKVLVIDTELTNRYLQEWWSAVQLNHPEQVHVLSMRGLETRLDFRDETLRNEWSEWCRDMGVTCVVLDCIAPVWSALGIEENSNTETGAWVNAFRRFTVDAHVSAGSVLIHHTGRDGSHSRGASRLNDWNDAELLIRKADNGDGEADLSAPRYYSAFGRDVHVPEFAVRIDGHVLYEDVEAPSRREQAVDRQEEARVARVNAKTDRIVEFLADNPGSVGRDIREALPGRPQDTQAAIKQGIEDGRIRTEQGPRRSILHYSEEPGAHDMGSDEGSV